MIAEKSTMLVISNRDDVVNIFTTSNSYKIEKSIGIFLLNYLRKAINLNISDMSILLLLP